MTDSNTRSIPVQLARPGSTATRAQVNDLSAGQIAAERRSRSLDSHRDLRSAFLQEGQRLHGRDTPRHVVVVWEPRPAAMAGIPRARRRNGSRMTPLAWWLVAAALVVGLVLALTTVLSPLLGGAVATGEGGSPKGRSVQGDKNPASSHSTPGGASGGGDPSPSGAGTAGKGQPAADKNAPGAALTPRAAATQSASGLPTPGAAAEAGAVSQARVPRIIGHSASDAAVLLKQAGLNISHSAEQDGTAPAGMILAVQPPVGSAHPTDGSVSVTVASGYQVVPNGVVGAHDSSAITALRTAGFAVRVMQQEINGGQPGVVLSCDQSTGVRLPLGTVITIVVEATPKAG